MLVDSFVMLIGWFNWLIGLVGFVVLMVVCLFV